MANDLVPPELIERFRSGECVFFVGAGMSTEGGLLSGREFRQLLIDKIQYPRLDVKLSKVAQALEDTIDRQTLIQLITDNFKQKGQELPPILQIDCTVRKGRILCSHCYD